MEIDRPLLIQTFAAEAEENLTAFEQGLVALEAQPEDGERLHAVFRVAHTLKGGASTVGFKAISEVAHDLESLLDRMRERAVPVDPSRVTLLLQAGDLLRDMLRRALAGDEQPPATAAPLRARVVEASRATATAAAANSLTPVSPSGPGSPAARTLRVDMGRLDRMLNLSGEIAIARGRLTAMLEHHGQLDAEELLESHREADRLYQDLQELIMKVRMVPVGPAFLQQLRTVRDQAIAQGKRARLTIEGDDVELDTSMMEHIRDPLNHLVRNAVAHGIEAPEARKARGKDPTGRVALRAFQDAGYICIQVADDGGGLDRQRIVEVGRAHGLLAEGVAPTGEALDRLIFEPGFTTAPEVTELAGRGVGLDVVRRNVEALRGSVAVESAPGSGTTITLRLPLTLAIIQGFAVGVRDESFVIPLDAVVECLELPPGERRSGEETGILNLRGHALPFIRLRELFGTPGAAPVRENVVVVRHGDSRAGIAVDELLGESQVVIKPLGNLFREVPGVSGCTIVGSGRVALILDVPAVLAAAVALAAPNVEPPPPEAPRVP